MSPPDKRACGLNPSPVAFGPPKARNPGLTGLLLSSYTGKYPNQFVLLCPGPGTSKILRMFIIPVVTLAPCPESHINKELWASPPVPSSFHPTFVLLP